MEYSIRFTKQYNKDLKKIDNKDKQIIYTWLSKNLHETKNPRLNGKALKGTKKGFWRYRIGKYRIIADIQDNELIILCLNVAKRGDIYKK